MIEDPLFYVTLCVVLAITPGPDVALVLRAATTTGFRAAVPVIGGIAAGLLTHVACSIVGVSALIAASDATLAALRVGGAFWIGWIGIGTLRDAFARDDANDIDTPRPAPTWRIGLVTNLVNAKILLFYLAFLPQFVPDDATFAPAAAVLASVQVAVGIAWLLLCAAIAGRLRQLLRPGARPRRVLDLVTGGILLLAAIELLWSAAA